MADDDRRFHAGYLRRQQWTIAAWLCSRHLLFTNEPPGTRPAWTRVPKAAWMFEDPLLCKNIVFWLLIIPTAITPVGSCRGCWSRSQLHMGQGRFHPWMSRLLIAWPYVSIMGFSNLLMGVSTVLWGCPGPSPVLPHLLTFVPNFNQQPSTAQSSSQQTRINFFSP